MSKFSFIKQLAVWWILVSCAPSFLIKHRQKSKSHFSALHNGQRLAPAQKAHLRIKRWTDVFLLFSYQPQSPLKTSRWVKINGFCQFFKRSQAASLLCNGFVFLSNFVGWLKKKQTPFNSFFKCLYFTPHPPYTQSSLLVGALASLNGIPIAFEASYHRIPIFSCQFLSPCNWD